MIRDLKIRPVTQNDAEALQQQCWPDLSIGEVEARIHSALSERAKSRGLVAEVGGGVVGFAQMNRWATRGEICNLIVAEGWRGEGIGTALIQRLIGAAREEGLRDVEIGAEEANPRAAALYRRLGFRDERRVMLDLGSGMQPVRYLVLDLGRGICEA